MAAVQRGGQVESNRHNCAVGARRFRPVMVLLVLATAFVAPALAVSPARAVQETDAATSDAPATTDLGVPEIEPRPCDGRSVLCVDGTADRGGRGTADAPFPTIQSAVDAAESGEIIQVRAGTYDEAVEVDGALSFLGGFSGDFTERSGDPSATVIRGGSDGASLAMRSYEPGGGVTVDGFRFTGGAGECAYGRCQGGGLYLQVREEVVVSRNEFVDNHLGGPDDEAWGGGASIEAPSRIAGNLFAGNRAHRGAGLTVTGETSVVGNTFVDNVGIGDHGGAAAFGGGRVRFERNHVGGNNIGEGLEFGWGGGVMITGSGTTFELSGNTFTGNEAPSSASAFFVDEGPVGTVTGDVFTMNLCSGEASSIVGSDSADETGTGSSITMRDVVITDNNCTGAASTIFTVDEYSAIIVETSTIERNGSAALVNPEAGTFTVDGARPVGRFGPRGSDDPDADPQESLATVEDEDDSAGARVAIAIVAGASAALAVAVMVVVRRRRNASPRD